MSSTLPPGNDRYRQPRQRRGSWGATAWGAMFVLVGGAWMLQALDVVEVDWAVLLPLALVATGVVLVFAARDRQAGGVFLLALVLLVASLAAQGAAAIDLGSASSFGDYAEEPTSVDDLDEGFSVAAGTLEVDLAGLSADELDDARRIAVNVAAGEAVVLVPDDVGVRLQADVAMGQATLFGDAVSGFATSRTVESDDYDDAGATVTIDGNVAMGSLRIERDG